MPQIDDDMKKQISISQEVSEEELLRRIRAEEDALSALKRKDARRERNEMLKQERGWKHAYN